MSVLSIFVDESGDFDLKSIHSPYYLFSLVFHNQEVALVNELDQLAENLRRNGSTHVHTGPLIRREKEYIKLTIDERRIQFINMYHFVRKCEIKYKTFIFKKSEYSDKLTLEGKMAKALKMFIQENLNYFSNFDRIIIYYDNGQHEITRMLNLIFNYTLNGVEARSVSPSQYSLFQVADFVCTMELLDLKFSKNELSRSEKKFFYKPKEPQKPYISTIKCKRLEKRK